MKNESSFDYEQELSDSGYDFVVGIDEAGRGPLAGPVTAVAVIFKGCHPERSPYSDEVEGSTNKYHFQYSTADSSTSLRFARNDNSFGLIRDSKTLSEKQRESLYDFIFDNFHVGVGICDHKTIDRMNILEATYLAMKKALADLDKNIKKCHSRENGNLVNQISSQDWIPAFAGRTLRRQIILVDGNKIIPNLSMEQKAIVNGDKIVKSISAASIVAKVTRDRMMREYHKKFSEYCFDKHKGYGTKIHLEAIKKYGICEIHRKSFEPVKSWTRERKGDKLESELY